MSQKFSYLVIVALAVLCFILVNQKSAADNTVSVAVPGNAPVNTQMVTPSIEVNATEFKKFQANQFVVYASIQMANRDKSVLSQQMGERRNKIFAIAKELEIPESDVQQNSVELRKEWSYREGVRKFVQYNGTQNFSITVDDKQNAANLVEALSIEFDIDVGRTIATLKNTDSLQKSIVDAAGKKAMEKAAMYAGSVGAKLGKIINIGTGYSDGVVMHDAGDVMLLSNGPMMKGARLNRSADMNAIADSVTLSAEIRLVVEIKQ